MTDKPLEPPKASVEPPKATQAPEKPKTNDKLDAFTTSLADNLAEHNELNEPGLVNLGDMDLDIPMTNDEMDSVLTNILTATYYESFSTDIGVATKARRDFLLAKIVQQLL